MIKLLYHGMKLVQTTDFWKVITIPMFYSAQYLLLSRGLDVRATISGRSGRGGEERRGRKKVLVALTVMLLSLPEFWQIQDL